MIYCLSEQDRVTTWFGQEETNIQQREVMHTFHSHRFQTTVRSLLFLGGFLAASLVTGGLGQTAFASAQVAASDPADGATVQSGLTTITITFTEEISVDQSSAQLAAQGQQSLAGVTTQVDKNDRKIMRLTTAPLEDGSYTVKWHAVSVGDNSLTNGQINFTVGNPPPASQQTPTALVPQPTATSAAVPVAGGTGTGSSDNTITWLLAGVIVVLLGVIAWQGNLLRRKQQGAGGTEK